MSNTFLNSFCVGIANKISIIWFFIFFSQSSKLYILFVVKTFVQSFSDIYVPKCCVDSSFNSRVILKVRLSSIYLFGFIGMSHWHRRASEGAEFWISYKQTAFLSNFSRLQPITNSAPSVTQWRHCDHRLLLPFLYSTVFLNSI